MLVNLELFTALTAAGVDHEKAEAAAAFFHTYERRLGRLEQIIDIAVRLIGGAVILAGLVYLVAYAVRG